jgi:hypothetical protein
MEKRNQIIAMLYQNMSKVDADDTLHLIDELCAGKTSNENCALPIPNVRLSLPDIRNKLSPIKNLIAMLNNGLMKGTIEVHPYIQKEMEQCKKSIAYLSGNEA